MPGAPVVIVGGGMSGLAAAYELGRRNVPFLLLEAAPSLGGVGVTGDPVLARVYRWPHANAQREVGHLALMARIDTRLAAHSGLFISAAGFRRSGIAGCVADGRRQAIAVAAAAPRRLTA
jgi:protoporphyrinogen oxidase